MLYLFINFILLRHDTKTHEQIYKTMVPTKLNDPLTSFLRFIFIGFEQRKVDIANHAPTYALANAEFSDNKDGSMSMIACRDIASDEEVCVCYGEHNNEQLLFCYGFVIPDNPCQGQVRGVWLIFSNYSFTLH